MLSRHLSAEAVAQESQGVPPPPSMTPVVSAKVQGLLDDLVSLNMLEVKELTDALKDRLGIDDSTAMPMAMNPAMFAGMGAAPASAPEEKVEEKTAFDLKLNKFDAAKKIAVIKEVRAITGLGLKEAKALVEEAPKVFKTEVSKDEAEQIRDKLKEVGGEVLLE
ncbi:Ribosomal protein L7/L12 [Gracilaria domingensis]|nr:Ribosomal protein L7/L12 [Gracilaria domingensis]